MTKLCARGKAAAKRKFKVYPSAYANAYASKICAGKIKDPSGVKKKDWGPKKMNKGGGAEIEPTPTPPTPLPSKKIINKAKEIKNKNKDPRKGLEFKKGKPPKGSSDHLNNPVVVREAKVGKLMTAGSQSAIGRLEKSGMRGGGIAIKGTDFKGVF